MLGILFAAAFASFPSPADSETLSQALRKAGIPETSFSKYELARSFDGAPVLSRSGRVSLFAYYDRSFPRKLRVVRYDAAAGTTTRALLRDKATTEASLQRGSMKINCLGALLEISEHGSREYLRTDLSPSAGCTIVLTPRLQPVAALSGWIVGFSGGRFPVICESQVHAPEAQLAISVYDAVRNREEPVYPVAGDRNARASQVAGFSANADARVFAFHAMPSHSSAAVIDYIFALNGATWMSRSLPDTQIGEKYHAPSLEAFVRGNPRAAFNP